MLRRVMVQVRYRIARTAARLRSSRWSNHTPAVNAKIPVIDSQRLDGYSRCTMYEPEAGALNASVCVVL